MEFFENSPGLGTSRRARGSFRRNCAMVAKFQPGSRAIERFANPGKCVWVWEPPDWRGLPQTPPPADRSPSTMAIAASGTLANVNGTGCKTLSA